jgi:hypothetical protein
MGKISGKVSKGLGAAIQEAQEKMNSSTDEVQELLNSGVEARKKRKSKSKESEVSTENSLFDAIMPAEEPKKTKQEPSHMRTHEEVCEDDIKKAHERGYPEPDFDFRDYYAKGQIIYYIHILGGGINTKELKRLKIRTIYPRMMVCDEEKSCCQCIGYDCKDYIFNTAKEAEPTYKSINLAVEEQPKMTKSGRKSDNNTDEEVEENTGENEAYTRLEEALDED